MVGLHLIKRMDGLSDEAACARFLDSPYVQLLCGEAHFQHALPLDRSSTARWRERIGPDTTVRPKAVTHPADGKLLHRGVEILGRLARRHSIALRRSYTRVSTDARREAAKPIRRGRRREAERVVRRMRTWLGRLARDIARKIASAADAVRATFATPLDLIARLL